MCAVERSCNAAGEVWKWKELVISASNSMGKWYYEYTITKKKSEVKCKDTHEVQKEKNKR